MSELEITGDFPEEQPRKVSNSQSKEEKPVKPAEEPKTKKKMSRWKKILIGLAASLMGTGATVGAIRDHIEYVRHVENFDAKEVKKVTNPNGIHFRLTPDTINGNRNVYTTLKKGETFFVIYGDKVVEHNKKECLSTTLIRAGIMGENGERIIGWVAEKQTLDNSDFWNERTTVFIDDVQTDRTAAVLKGRIDIYTGEEVTLAWKSKVYRLGDNTVACIDEDGNVKVIKVEEGDLEGDLSMSKNNANKAFRMGIKPENDEGNNKGNNGCNISMGINPPEREEIYE